MTEQIPTNGKRPVGRPPGTGRPFITPDSEHPLFDATVASVIIQRIYAGSPLHEAAEACGVSDSTMHHWRSFNADFHLAVSHALESHHDSLAQTLVTAHDDIPDTQKARLYSDNVKWLLSKRDKRYSDRLDVNVETRVSLADALKEATGRVLSTSYQVIPDATQAIDYVDYQDVTPTDRVSDSDNDELADLLS